MIEIKDAVVQLQHQTEEMASSLKKAFIVKHQLCVWTPAYFAFHYFHVRKRCLSFQTGFKCHYSDKAPGQLHFLIKVGAVWAGEVPALILLHLNGDPSFSHILTHSGTTTKEKIWNLYIVQCVYVDSGNYIHAVYVIANVNNHNCSKNQSTLPFLSLVWGLRRVFESSAG